MKTAAHEALEQVALDEYRAHLGKCLEVDYICGYNDTDDSGDYECIPPLIVRVVKTDTSSILHWNCSHNDDWLDPYWDVEVVSGKLPGPISAPSGSMDPLITFRPARWSFAECAR